MYLGIFPGFVSLRICAFLGRALFVSLGGEAVLVRPIFGRFLGMEAGVIFSARYLLSISSLSSISPHGKRGGTIPRRIDDKTGQEKTRQDKKRHDREKQDKAGRSKTRQGKTRQGKTRQGRTRNDRTGQDRTRQNKTRQAKTRQNRTRHDKTRKGKPRKDEPRLD